MSDYFERLGTALLLRESVKLIRKLALTEASLTGREVCGLLIYGDDRQSMFAKPTRNAAKKDDEYMVDPDDYREAFVSGVDIAGVYHSHVYVDENPSGLDRLAFVPMLWYVVYSVLTDKMSMTMKTEEGDEIVIQFSTAKGYNGS